MGICSISVTNNVAVIICVYTSFTVFLLDKFLRRMVALNKMIIYKFNKYFQIAFQKCIKDVKVPISPW